MFFRDQTPPVLCSPLLAPLRFQRRISPPVFVVVPGISPVSPKLVAAIVSGEFIDLASLLEDRIEPASPVFTLVDNQLIIRPTKRCKAITDILSWMQAFAVHTLGLTTYYPARVADLLKYQFLIMRTALQFSGSGLCSAGRSFQTHRLVSPEPRTISFSCLGWRRC